MKKIVFINLLILLFVFGITPAHAALSKSATVRVGNPTIVSNSFGDLANKIMNNLLAACPADYIASGDASCMEFASLPQDVLSGFYGSLGFRGVLECLGFVQTLFLHATGEVLFAPGDRTKDIPPNYIPAGFTFISSAAYGGSGDIMQPGDIPIWDTGDFGHIGITTETDGFNFKFAEANNCFNPCGKIDFGHDDTGNNHLKGWIRKVE